MSSNSSTAKIYKLINKNKIKFKIGDLHSAQQADGSEESLDFPSLLTGKVEGNNAGEAIINSLGWGEKYSLLAFYFFQTPKAYPFHCLSNDHSENQCGSRRLDVTWFQIQQHKLLWWEVQAGAQLQSQWTKTPKQ
jgi:hypothetical protein